MYEEMNQENEQEHEISEDLTVKKGEKNEKKTKIEIDIENILSTYIFLVDSYERVFSPGI